MKSGAFLEFLQFLNSLSTAEDSLGSFSIDDGDGSENVFSDFVAFIPIR